MTTQSNRVAVIHEKTKNKRKAIMQAQDITETLRSEIPYLKENYGVKRIALFGSFAKRNHTKTSDIDMVVEFEKPIGLKFINLAEYLEKRLGRKTDILTNDGIKSIRIKKVAQDIKRSLQYV